MKKDKPSPRNIGRDFAKGYSMNTISDKYGLVPQDILIILRKHIRTLRRIERRSRK